MRNKPDTGVVVMEAHVTGIPLVESCTPVLVGSPEDEMQMKNLWNRREVG